MTIHHEPCDDCGSSDALSIYPDGSTWCFACESYHKGNEGIIKEKRMTSSKLTTGLYLPLKDRNIKEDTCKKYGVTVLGSEDSIEKHIYPYHDKRGEKVANKVRELPKSFTVQGSLSNNVGMFGQHLFAEGGKAITLFEGEIDAMSGYELTGSAFPCVSVPNGSSSAKASVKANLEYLETFEKIVICFDNDEPGQTAAKEIAGLFTLGKAHIMKLDRKDANEYLQTNGHKEFTKKWWESKPWTPDGIVRSSELLERIQNKKEIKSLPYPWDGLNKKTYGIRKGELVSVTADTGIGKTNFLREIIYNINDKEADARIGCFFLEETPEDSGLGLMSIFANKPLHIPDTEYTENEFISAYNAMLKEDKFYFYDSFGSTSIDNIISRVRYYAKGLDCDYIILDHLSIIVSDMSNGDERKALDEITTKLKTLTIELDIALIAVVHTNRQGQIRGTAGVEQLSNVIIHLDRDPKAKDAEVRNTTEVTVWKNRFCGKTGIACYLRYDEITGRMHEVEETDEWSVNE